MARDFHLPGRSQVIAAEGMAATSHPLATLAAIDVLRAGGTAADAAVTAVAVLCVVEPHMTGIGGDCFCLISDPGKPVWGYNGCGRAGAKASTEALLSQGIKQIGMTSPHAVTVPGSIEAWDAILKAHGTLPAGARAGARDPLRRGRLSGRGARRVGLGQCLVGKLKADPGAARHYLFDGRAPAEGDVSSCRRSPRRSRRSRRTARARSTKGRLRDDIVATLDAMRLGAHRPTISRKHRGEAPTADLDQLSRHRSGRDAAERAGPGRAGDAQHPGERSTSSRSIRWDRSAYHLMLEAARMAYRGARHPHRRSGAHAREGGGADRQGVRQARSPAKLDRAKRVPLPTAPHAGQRHGLSHRGRPRPQGGVVHQLALFGVRRRHLQSKRPA